MEYSYHMQQRFPSLEITAEVKQPPAMNRALASTMGFAQIAAFCVSMFGDQIFAAVSQPTPDWAKYLQENRGMAIGGFFFSNMIVNGMVQTGAFEVFLGGELVHSKIKTGQVPDFNSLVARVHSMNPGLSGGTGAQRKQQYHGIEHNARARVQAVEDEEDDEF